MDSDLSFYKEFGYTHNYTFEFYSTQDGNVHYEVFVNNEKESSLRPYKIFALLEFQDLYSAYAIIGWA